MSPVKFAEVFGEPTPSHNKVWLVKRIAWRLQAKAEGDLSERTSLLAASYPGEALPVIGAVPNETDPACREQTPPVAGQGPGGWWRRLWDCLEDIAWRPP